MTFLSAMEQGAVSYGLDLTATQYDQLNRYYELLIAGNEKMNLTAITSPQEVAVKHMIDSLSAAADIAAAPAANLIDVGTGAGFPGIPLKIYLPELEVTLLDSLQKRVGFLQTVVTELGLQGIRCLHSRAEDGAREANLREKFAVAVSRAVAPLPVLAEYCLPFVKVGGKFLALKGKQYQTEMTAAKKAVQILGGGSLQARRVSLPGLEDVRAVVIAEKLRPTPAAYPRKAGLPAKNPLSH
ncbi:MAG: 16S rRNA (guanine(527)-N(7))-methyltransferase RsmG [Selenomonadaceae bacterium]|nr:16S rRNA (guanine(527)-N(7))-methyltransferase RsmG [Selenomonadaceae bacterium]